LADHRAEREGEDRIRRRGQGAWLLALALSGVAWAQVSFPNRNVRVVNPYSAGSVADVFGRIVTRSKYFPDVPTMAEQGFAEA